MMNYYIASFLYIIFWLGIGLLVYWFFKQFQSKKDSNLLAGGLILVYIVSALWCASVWFSFNDQYLGGWGMGAINNNMHEQMEEFIQNNDKTVITGLVLITIVVLATIMFAFNKQVQQQETIPQYQVSDTEKPQVVIEESTYDFGSIKLSDIKKTIFTIKNSGSAPLYLSDILTSCGCTSAVIEINGQVSPAFSMHDNPKWIGTVEPNSEAIVKVTYDAKVHPVEGEVERYIQIATNDPANAQIQLSITANVSK